MSRGLQVSAYHHIDLLGFDLLDRRVPKLHISKPKPSDMFDLLRVFFHILECLYEEIRVLLMAHMVILRRGTGRICKYRKLYISFEERRAYLGRRQRWHGQVSNLFRTMPI